MEFDVISKWLGLVSLIVSVVTAVWTLISKSTKPFDDKLSGHDEDLKNHDRRIQKVEDELAHLPSKTEVHDIKLAIARLEGHFGKLEASAAATERTVRRIDDYLREETK